MRGFVASGGGSRGQFHVGVLRYFLSELQTPYDAYAGVSVGALICAHLAMYNKGEEREAYKSLEAIFTPVKDRDIYKKWFPLGVLHGLIKRVPWLYAIITWLSPCLKQHVFKPSLFNSKPLQKLVRKLLDKERLDSSDKLLKVGAVSYKTKEYKVFSKEHPEIVEAVLASSSYPGFFLPVEVEGELWVDGGVRTVSPIKALIDAGCDSIDVSICHPPTSALTEELTDPSAVDVILASLEGQGDEVIWDDVKKALMYNQVLKHHEIEGKRHIDIRLVYPTKQLNKNPLRFKKSEAMKMQKAGYEAAKK